MNTGPIRSLADIGSAAPRVLVAADGDTAAEMLRGVITRGTTSLDAELFGVVEAPIVRALSERLDNGASLRLHADHERLGMGYYDEGLLARDNVSVTTPGPMPLKTHMKVLVSKDEAWLSTTGPHRWSARPFPFIDMAATFGPEDAQLLQRMLRAAQSGNQAEIAASAQAGVARGFVLNDPAHGVTLLSDTVGQLIAEARSELLVASKVADDKVVFRDLADAARRGVDVVAETTYRNTEKQMKRITKASGGEYQISVQEAGSPLNMHMNFVVADGEIAYIGTGHLTKRGMGREDAKRPSRELGIITRDRALIERIVDSVAPIPGSRMGEGLRPR